MPPQALMPAETRAAADGRLRVTGPSQPRLRLRPKAMDACKHCRHASRFDRMPGRPMPPLADHAVACLPMTLIAADEYAPEYRSIRWSAALTAS